MAEHNERWRPHEAVTRNLWECVWAAFQHLHCNLVEDLPIYLLTNTTDWKKPLKSNKYPVSVIVATFSQYWTCLSKLCLYSKLQPQSLLEGHNAIYVMITIKKSSSCLTSCLESMDSFIRKFHMKNVFSLQIWRHGSKHHRREDLWIDLLSERRPGDRPSCTCHRVQLQPDLPPEPESGQEESTAGLILTFQYRAQNSLTKK